MRRTVTIDDGNHSRIQNIRADHLMKTGKDYSYSQCLNDLIEDALRHK